MVFQPLFAGNGRQLLFIALFILIEVIGHEDRSSGPRPVPLRVPAWRPLLKWVFIAYCFRKKHASF
jgi:hypothetical protein